MDTEPLPQREAGAERRSFSLYVASGNPGLDGAFGRMLGS